MNDKQGGYSSGPSESKSVLPIYPTHRTWKMNISKINAEEWHKCILLSSFITLSIDIDIYEVRVYFCLFFFLIVIWLILQIAYLDLTFNIYFKYSSQTGMYLRHGCISFNLVYIYCIQIVNKQLKPWNNKLVIRLLSSECQNICPGQAVGRFLVSQCPDLAVM